MLQPLVRPLARAVSQLSDRVFVGVTLGSLLWSLVSFAGLLAGSVWLLHGWVAGGGWLGWLAGLLGGLGVLLAAVWFYVPVAMLIAALYVNSVAGAVERRFYPGLPSAAAAPWTEQVWDGVVLAGQLGALQVLGLVLSLLLPGVGLVLGVLITGWAIGRGLFVAVAMRRMGRAAALAAYRELRPAVIVPGVALALIGMLPPLNLLIPVLGIAAMTHVLALRPLAAPRAGGTWPGVR